MGFPPAVQQAWDNSVLHNFGSRATEVMADAARDHLLRPGEVLARHTNDVATAPLCLVVDGLMRVYVQSRSGREVTVRYASPGDLVGVPATIGDRLETSMQPAGIQAITTTEVLSLSPKRLVALAASDVSVAWPVAQYLANEIHLTEQFWASNMFLPMRARVAHHLLDMAVRKNGELIVEASQQDLANAVGSVREVIARTLRDLAQERFLTRTAQGIVLTLPAALHRIAAEAAVDFSRAS